MWTMLLLAALAGQADSDACPIDKGRFDAAWHQACDTAIAAAPDAKTKALLLFRSAFADNDVSDNLAARPKLEQAVRLDPANANAWHELGYTANALGDFAEGEQAANAEIGLRTDVAAAYQERAYARLRLADFVGTYADRDREVALSPGKADPLIGRVEAAMWLGRFDQVRTDLGTAESLGDAAMRRMVASDHARLVRWSTPSAKGAAACAFLETGEPGPNYIGDCTAAFLAGKTPAERAEALTNRAIGWLAIEDQEAAMMDQMIAAAIEPGNADRHANLGFALLSVRHSWAAERAFDRALAIKESWAALGGRAMARYNQKNAEGAFADAKRSFEIAPNEIALTVLGDIAHDQGDDKSARLYWMGAYHGGATGDPMLSRLKSIGIDHPEKEPRSGS